jgi:hypothetical protein
MRAADTLSPEPQEPRTRTLSIFKTFPPKHHLHEPRIGLLVRLRQKLQKVELIVQLHTQSKLTIRREANTKNWTQNQNFKSQRTCYACVQTSDLFNDTKNTTKSRETTVSI